MNLTPYQVQKRGEWLLSLATKASRSECPYCHRPFSLGAAGVEALLIDNLETINAMIAVMYPDETNYQEGVNNE